MFTNIMLCILCLLIMRIGRMVKKIMLCALCLLVERYLYFDEIKKPKH